MLVNRVFRDILDFDPVGKLCYQAFQGFDHICTSCANSIIHQNDGQPYTWGYFNPNHHQPSLFADGPNDDLAG